MTVRSEGYLYGHVCSTGGVYVPIDNDGGGGCNTPTLKQDSSTVDTTTNVRTSAYKINIKKTAPLEGKAILLLTFSQPVSSSNVAITGSVYDLIVLCSN